MMHLHNFNFLIVGVIISIASHSLAEEVMNNVVHLKLYHAFDNKMNFISRGSLTVSGKEVSINQNPMTLEDIGLLKQAVLDDGYYYIKSVAVASPKDGAELKSATTFIKACSLYESLLSDVLVLTLDANGHFLALAATTTNPHCLAHPRNALPTKLINFNTTVHVTATGQAPGPDTQTYILRLEQEKAEKMRGDKADNRSFLAKYWMYIIPVVVFLLISGASNQEAQGGR